MKMTMTCRLANRRNLSSSVTAGVHYHRGGRSKEEDTRLATLLDSRALGLSREILSNDRSSIADRITALEGEMRVLKNRGFKVPTGKERLDDDDDLCRELIEAFDPRERVEIYRRRAERQERDERRNMITLEKMDDKRYFANQFFKGKYSYSFSHSLEFENSSTAILPNQFGKDLLTASVKLNTIFGFQFGQPMVVDMGLPYRMSGVEVTSFYSQMKDLYLTNQLLPEPYNIYLCNFDETDEVAAGLLEVGGGDCPWNVSSKCFSDLFPRENLVYMTPDSPHLVSGHRFDDIFILGACVDVLDPDSAKGISYAKAQRLGIRSARLDLDSFFNLGAPRGGPNWDKPESFPLLAACDVFDVIADARESRGNWDLAHRTLTGGRKRVLKWKSEKDDLIKKMNDFRFQQILESFRSSSRASSSI